MNDLISRNAAVQRVANVSPVMQPAEALASPAEALASLNYHLGFTDGRKAAEWAIRALPAASQPEAEPVAWNGQTGIKDKDGRMICVGDRIRINLTSKNTKEEYWLPEYVVEWVPPSFTLKYVGGGKDSDTARWRFRTPQSSMKKEIETVSTTPAPVVPADQRAAIEALADRMWRVHPKDIHAAGCEHLERGGKYENPRAAWYADQIEALFKQFRDQVSPVVPAEGLVAAMREAIDLLTERKQGSSARSPGHNARLVLESALRSAPPVGARVRPWETRPADPDAMIPATVEVHRGAWAVVIGTNGKPAGWIDTHDLFANQLYRDHILTTPAALLPAGEGE